MCDSLQTVQVSEAVHVKDEVVSAVYFAEALRIDLRIKALATSRVDNCRSHRAGQRQRVEYHDREIIVSLNWEKRDGLQYCKVQCPYDCVGTVYCTAVI